MATILAFTPRKTAGGAFPAPLAKAGDVIIFPGVRYEQSHALSERDGAHSADGPACGGEGSGEPRH
jgi:hypothetical protein